VGFSKKVRKEAYEQHGGRCAGCHEPMAKDKRYSHVAHICAASPGGPRYGDLARLGMSEADRGTARNAVVLCRQPCHAKVDGNPKQYSAARLLAVKLHHEKVIAAVRAIDDGATLVTCDTAGALLTAYRDLAGGDEGMSWEEF
jgi:hypothetical protein